ncbi:MAG: hypothetical protein CMA58_01520 [Euryarchaeota archaeon]|nr:hypothetical protein [Euryarchaeota archaeon]
MTELNSAQTVAMSILTRVKEQISSYKIQSSWRRWCNRNKYYMNMQRSIYENRNEANENKKKNQEHLENLNHGVKTVTIPVNFRKITKFFADIPDWNSFPGGDRENKDVYYNVFSSTRRGKKNDTNNEVISLSDGNKKKASTFTVVTNSWMNSMHRNESFFETGAGSIWKEEPDTWSPMINGLLEELDSGEGPIRLWGSLGGHTQIYPKQKKIIEDLNITWQLKKIRDELKQMTRDMGKRKRSGSVY